MAQDLARRWGPRIESWAQVFIDRSRPPPDYAMEEDEPAFEVKKKDDGSYAVELGSGVDLVQEGPKRWRLAPKEPSDGGKFRVSELAAEGVDRALRYVSLNVLELLKVGQTLIAGVARGVFLLFMTLMVAGYIMHTRENILEFFRSLAPPRTRLGLERLLWRMDRGLAGVVRGQLLICLVNGVLSAIGFWMFGLKYWPILAIIAGVMSLIPIFGSILSSIPAVLIGLTQDFWTALWVLLWIIGIHQVEANLLNPKIIGVAAKIHPVLVVFALIVGEHFYGLWGALLAVPTLSLTQSVFNHFRFETMPDVPPDSVVPPAARTPSTP
jgi:predicted PurR-regulated permease PerM